MAIATATLISAAINVVASVALSFVAKALRKKPKVDTDSLDFEQTVQRRLRNGQPLEVLVGRRIAAGVGVFDDAWSTKNEKGVSVTILSAKPCTQFHKLFVDGEPVTLSGNPAIGEVEVTSHFGGEYCVLVTECRNTNDDFDEDSGENYIPFQGYPEFKVELSGVKVCDPRSGGVYSDESTYAYSNNAALIDAQYDYGWHDGVGDGRALIVGNGYPEGLLDLARIQSNADYCDAEGFTCAGIVRSGASDQEEIWKCYNADRVEHPASIYSVPEGNRTHSETVDLSQYPAAHISQYDEDGYSTEVYNEIQTVYAEPEEFYGEKDLPIYSDPGWITADNHIPRQMSLPLLFVTDKVQAARLQKQEICISRTPATCTIADLPFGFIRMGVGDVITVSGCAVAAINDRQWIVKGKGQSPMGDVSLMLRAFAGADAFDFDEATEIPIININFPPFRPWPWWERLPYVNPGTVAGINIDVNGIIAGTTELANVTLIGRGSLNGELDGIGTNISGLDSVINNAATGLGATHTEVQAIVSGSRLLGDVKLTDAGSLKSLLQSQADNINTAITQTAGPNLVLTADNASVFGTTNNGNSATSGSVSASASGGTSPYTYSWTFVSGDSGITIGSASGSMTTFSGTPGTNNSLTASFKCTVTDDASDSTSVNVTVTLTDWTDFGGTGGGLEP